MEHFCTWTRNGMPIVTTPDGVDIANEDALPGILRDAATFDSVVIVDAATCKTFFSARAMRMLDDAARTMAGEGGELRIAIPQPRRRQILELCLAPVRSDRHLRIFEDLGEALAAPQADWQPQLQPQAA
jgi:hypothetical protein